MAIQIGKYRRPGIFIEEFDNSVIVSPTVTGVTSLVAGFSRKGPVNTPVLLQTVTDLERIFGPLDRNLERKGSFFHRTIAKMLESSPVFAMNLLSTSDTLDLLEYKSVSTSTDKNNDIIREESYRRFFDTTGFWKRDTDAFINLTSNDLNSSDRLLSFTNMSDKFITIFVFKTKVGGFDRTLLEFYGSADKVPTYVNQLDFASDYMVDVLVVAGDWSNYAQLSVDNKWSAYFNSNGLDKNQVDNFANDRNVNLLAYYQGLSLIPFFRDSNGRNIFIETIINNETDRTGLFCAFDMDKFEKDYPTGMVDLIGNNLVSSSSLSNSGQKSIEFLSYDATILENLSYTQTQLDDAGGEDGQNVVAFGPSMSNLRNVSVGRTVYFSEEYINNIQFSSFTVSSTTVSVSFATTSNNNYAVFGGTTVSVAGPFNFSLSSNSFIRTNSTASYYSVIHLNNTGTINITNGSVGSYPSIPASDLVLGSINYQLILGNFVTSSIGSYATISVGSSGFSELLYNDDYLVTNLGSGSIRVTFQKTAQVDVTSDYNLHRKIRLFNYLVNLLESNEGVVMLRSVTTKEKFRLPANSISNIVTSTTQNKSFDLNLGLTEVPSDILSGNLVFYKIDNELVLGGFGFTSSNSVYTQGATYGVVGLNSDFYLDFINGQISTGDYFYRNILKDNTTPRVYLGNTGGNGYIVFSEDPWAPSTDWGFGFNGDEEIILPDSISNTGTLAINGSTNFIGTSASLVDPLTGLTFSDGVQYKLESQVVDENITSISKIYDATTKVYLQMYLENNNLITKFLNQDFTSPIEIDNTLDSNLHIFTNNSNYKQTIEIEEPSGYTPISNKILCNAIRYSEVKIGDFLKAYVDPNVDLEAGEQPRNLTRITNKRIYAADNTLVEITCDAAIDKISFNSDKQSVRYTTIDDYVSFYKAIPLKGFRVREASMPDGTEVRQSAILNLVAKGTPLFKALTNKEAIDFRYVIDSFGLGLIERSKQQLVDICGERLDCLGFLNMPSIKSFKNSTSPSFVDSEGVVQTSLIAAGGDLESSPAFLYSFGDGRGASCVGYFTPYVTMNDNGRPTDVPPAMHVATTYMRKQNTNVTSVVPWTIAAGVTNGRVTNIAGIEMNFTPEDIENLNGAQMNPIVFKRNRGFVIETENTGQTLYKSALSFLHVREVLIELERELSAMLLEFQWKFNTPEIRAEIKLRADVICEKYVSKNGLYNYFNKCDEENNTPTIIDNQIGVLDTYVEPIKGMGIIVNNITILRTGAIQAGGFINQ